MAEHEGERRAEGLVARRRELLERLAAACVTAGRDPASVTLVAVSKGFPATDVAVLAADGQRDFGESRDQDARPKAEAVPGVRWHFVGRLQRNKCRSVARYASVVHGVDGAALAAALGTAATAAGRPVTALVQVSLDGDPTRGGTVATGVAEVADAVLAAGLRLGGVMAVPPVGWDADEAYAALARVAADLRRVHPEATTISAGMSGDLEQAVRHGATHVRVGTALFGERARPVG